MYMMLHGYCECVSSCTVIVSVYDVCEVIVSVHDVARVL